MTEETDSIRVSLGRFTHRENKRQLEKRDREELLARAEVGRRVKNEMDEEAQVMGSVGRSKAALEEIYSTGTNILVTMAGTRERLKVRQGQGSGLRAAPASVRSTPAAPCAQRRQRPRGAAGARSGWKRTPLLQRRLTYHCAGCRRPACMGTLVSVYCALSCAVCSGTPPALPLCPCAFSALLRCRAGCRAYASPFILCAAAWRLDPSSLSSRSRRTRRR